MESPQGDRKRRSPNKNMIGGKMASILAGCSKTHEENLKGAIVNEGRPV